MDRHTRLLFALALGVSLVTVWLVADVAPLVAEPNNVEIAYHGELLDEGRKPIGGVYPLEFKLYNDRMSERALWTETHWVAVVDGVYDVRLGSESRIRNTLARPGARLYLGINLMGGGELLREPLSFPGSDKAEPVEPEALADGATAEPATPVVDAPVPAKDAPPTPATPTGKPEYKTESSFAEVAEFAKRAGTADNADKLDGKSLAELEAEIERLRDELSRHRTDKDGHSGAGGGEVKVGGETTVLPKVGGRGGAAYNRECPPGYVVTGIRGAAGALIDSIQLICSPLER